MKIKNYSYNPEIGRVSPLWKLVYNQKESEIKINQSYLQMAGRIIRKRKIKKNTMDFQAAVYNEWLKEEIEEGRIDKSALDDPAAWKRPPLPKIVQERQAVNQTVWFSPPRPMIDPGRMVTAKDGARRLIKNFSKFGTCGLKK